MELVPTDSLLPHEETLKDITEEISRRIRQDGFVIHPIVAERESLVILDGMHRAAALRLLKTPLSPVHLVDYMSSNVILNCWYRIAYEPIPEDTILELAERLGLRTERQNLDTAIKAVEERRNLLCFLTRTSRSAVALKTPGSLDILTIYRYVSEVDKVLRSYSVVYMRESEALDKIRRGEAASCWIVPRVRKHEVINLAKHGHLLPPKTTRHIIYGRPMFTFTPLEILNMSDVEAARERNRRLLQGMKYVVLPPNKVIDRLYEEDVRVYIQEDEQLLKKYYPEGVLRIIREGAASP